MIRLHGIADDLIVDGPGLRLAMFVQGCDHGCEGCHNPESHPRDGGTIWRIEDVIGHITPITQGVTLTGGEPFDQAGRCWEVAKAAHDRGLDVWAYTGYLFEDLAQGRFTVRLLLSEVDVLVDGPFVKALSSYTLKWKGSSNQRIIDVRESIEKGKAIEWSR